MSEIKLKPCPFCGNGKIEILSEPEELDDINYSQFVACCSVLERLRRNGRLCWNRARSRRQMEQEG